MEFGASFAYRKIDAQVEATLNEAAQILKGIEQQRGGEQSAIKSESISVSQQTTSVSIRRSSKEPTATIRTPRDVNKHRKIVFPQAEIGAKSSTLMSSKGGSETSYDTVSNVPSDSLFPSAIYIPAKQGSHIDVRIGASSSSSCSTQSVYRKQIEKLATEPLVDIKHLKNRNVKKSKPDHLFPKATYSAGTGKPKLAMSPVTTSTVASSKLTSSEASSASLVYQPMEFVSADGRLKMMLQPIEENASKKLKKPAPPSETDVDEFPIVPKQLQSCTKLKTENRTKFSTKIQIGDNSIDLSGIFNGNSMKTSELAKLVINGQSFSI